MFSRGKRLVAMTLPPVENVNKGAVVTEPDENMPPLIEDEELEDPFAGDDDFNDPDFILNLEPDFDRDSEEEHVLPKKKAKTSNEIRILYKKDENIKTPGSVSFVVPSNQSRIIRKERKDNRNAGKSYVTDIGKVVTGRHCVEQLPECRMKCRNNFDYNTRKELFDAFWLLESRDRKADYINGLVMSVPKATQRLRHIGGSIRNRPNTNIYNLKINGQLQTICKTCFQKTFDVTDGFIKYLLACRITNIAGIIKMDQRGRHSPTSKTSEERKREVVEHINRFPRYESHYSRRHTEKQYLAANLNVSLMYSLYKEQNGAPVSYGIYRQIFSEMNLSFKLPHNDTCNTCDTFSLQFKLAMNDNQEAIQTEWNKHKDMADKHFLAKSKDKEEAKVNKSKKMLTFDLQQVLATPHVQTSIVFYKRQLSVYNLTVYVGAEGIANNFLWDETIAGRGANQIGSCVFKYLLTMSAEICHVVMYSDTCTGQNRNSHMAAMCFSALQHNPALQIIDHKFMVSGHSHMECDTAHAMIEKKKKRTNMRIHHPRDWAQLIRSVGKKDKFLVTEMQQEDFLDFKSLYNQKLQIKKKNSENDKFVWHDIQWMRFTKDHIGIIQYKNTIDDDAPFKHISFLRRRQENPILEAKCQYSALLPITEDKKRNLMSILHLVDPVFHNYYKNLPTSLDASNDPGSSSEGED